MPVTINEIEVEVPHMSELQARRLAAGIGSHLRTAGMNGIDRMIHNLNVEFTSTLDADVDQLARQIAADIVRQIKLSKTP